MAREETWANKLNDNSSEHTSHPANYVPFIFTSEKEQEKAGGLWYAMWVNPSSLELGYGPNHSVVYTKGGYGFLHWKNKPPTLSFKGVSGWLRPNFVGDSGVLGEASTIESWSIGDLPETGVIAGINKVTKDFFRESLQQTFLESNILPGIMIGEKGIEDPQTAPTNNPRLFVRRLQRVATQEKYYVTTLGNTIPNTRKIKIFSKFFPGGVVVNGNFTSFQIVENAKDSQLINYSISFLVQDGLSVDSEGGTSLETLFKGFKGFKIKSLFQ